MIACGRFLSCFHDPLGKVNFDSEKNLPSSGGSPHPKAYADGKPALHRKRKAKTADDADDSPPAANLLLYLPARSQPVRCRRSVAGNEPRNLRKIRRFSDRNRFRV